MLSMTSRLLSNALEPAAAALKSRAPALTRSIARETRSTPQADPVTIVAEQGAFDLTMLHALKGEQPVGTSYYQSLPKGLRDWKGFEASPGAGAGTLRKLARETVEHMRENGGQVAQVDVHAEGQGAAEQMSALKRAAEKALGAKFEPNSSIGLIDLRASLSRGK